MFKQAVSLQWEFQYRVQTVVPRSSSGPTFVQEIVRDGKKCFYWHPGGSGNTRKLWYSGVIKRGYEVNFPSGQIRNVIGIN